MASTFKTKLPLVDLNMLGVITGQVLETGQAVLTARRDFLTVGAGNTVTLYAPPVTTYDPFNIFVLNNVRDLGTQMTLGTPASTPGAYSISGTTVTLNATTCPVGSTVAAFYDYAAPTTSNQIQLNCNLFPNYVRITGEGIMTNAVNTNVVPVIWDVKKCKVQPNFTITMEKRTYVC